MNKYPKTNQLKYAFSLLGVPPTTDISNVINKIQMDNALNYAQKSQLMSVLYGLPDHAKSQVSNFSSSLFGAGAGFAIAKFILGLGFGGSLLGALVGAMIARPKNNSNYFNPFI